MVRKIKETKEEILARKHNQKFAEKFNQEQRIKYQSLIGIGMSADQANQLVEASKMGIQLTAMNDTMIGIRANTKGLGYLEKSATKLTETVDAAQARIIADAEKKAAEALEDIQKAESGEINVVNVVEEVSDNTTESVEEEVIIPTDTIETVVEVTSESL